MKVLDKDVDIDIDIDIRPPVTKARVEIILLIVL